MKALIVPWASTIIILQTLILYRVAAEEHSNIFNHTARVPGPFQIGEEVPFIISTDLDQSEIQPETIIKGERVSDTYTLYHEGASYLALHFASLDIEGTCRLLITDRVGKQAYSLKGKDKNGLTSFWARYISGDTAVLSVTCHGRDGIGNFHIDKYVAGFRHLSTNTNANDEERPNLRGIENLLQWDDQRRHLAICGADDLLNSQCFMDTHPTEYKMSRAVAKIVINGRGVCTGWLLGNQNTLVTNWHCIRGTTDALNSYVIFNYEVQNGGGDCTQSIRESVPNEIQDVYDVDSLLASVYLHDYALIKLKDRESAPLKRYGFLQTEPRSPAVGEEIYMPQHPRGDDKAIAMWDSQYGSNQRCRALQPVVSCFGASQYLDVRYTCDTEPGSSGAPVISAQTHKVMALHHCSEASTCSGNEGVPSSYLHNVFRNIIGDWSLPPMPQMQQCLDDEYEMVLELQTDVFGYETTFELRNSTGTLLDEQGKIMYFRSNEFYTFKYCLPRDEYTLVIDDSYQDGMCCQHGNGNYTVYVDGQTIASGGSFQSSVVITFGGNTPELAPAAAPSETPSFSIVPSMPPSTEPSREPWILPSRNPSGNPSTLPSLQTYQNPSASLQPSPSISTAPSILPSQNPSHILSLEPSKSKLPSHEPSIMPSKSPSIEPSDNPSVMGSFRPSISPSQRPSAIPSTIASSMPSIIPSNGPSRVPSISPSAIPTVKASDQPSTDPSRSPSQMPSLSQVPSQIPSLVPSRSPTAKPSQNPSSRPSSVPSSRPSSNPSTRPSSDPSSRPSSKPSSRPSTDPTSGPTSKPSSRPSFNPTSGPTSSPTSSPTRRPTFNFFTPSNAVGFDGPRDGNRRRR